jgi:hypothetical protein
MFYANFNANDLVELGQCLVVLKNPKVWNGQNYVANRDEFIRRVNASPFSATAAASQKLAQYIVSALPKGSILASDANELESMSKTIELVLSHETRKATAILTDIQPPRALVSLACPEQHQLVLKNDLITCLQVNLARPAIVVAWALGYDLVRYWIHNEPTRLAAFNRQLAKNPRTGEPNTITDYHDFFRLGEWRFLEICKDSQDAALTHFTEKTFRNLSGLLDQRNEFAHANYALATMVEATAYVERLVRIVTSPPFDT